MFDNYPAKIPDENNLQLYIYPIKSLREVSLSSAVLTPQGLAYDRRFMLRVVGADGTRTNMGCYDYPLMVRFLVSLDLAARKITVTFHPPDGQAPRAKDVPLLPDATQLEEVTITLHGSPTTGYHMGQEYASWFSSCFGYEVELLYVGENRRKMRGTLSPNEASTTWMQKAGQLLGASAPAKHEQGLALSDCAPILLVSKTSLQHANRLLSPGLEADITKFRPNIIISGAADEYEEDFWRDISIAGNKLLLTANCNRCMSLNVDYDTGTFCKGELGSVLKKLTKDRRVDKGAKYSPIFGRYGFVEQAAHGSEIEIGDAVEVLAVNTERTTFGINKPPRVFRNPHLQNDRLARPSSGRAPRLMLAPVRSTCPS